MITLNEWAEVRRLHGAEVMSIKETARRLGLARNTVRAALRADAPPSRERGPRGSLVDKVGRTSGRCPPYTNNEDGTDPDG